jgi:cobyrinic acid a,c-diamide synthase
VTVPRLVIAGTHSGVGKTTLALALMTALRRRGLTVQPFKVGPDFIDPGHHGTVCGRASYNLDTWMLSESAVAATFARASAAADVAVIEGVMGLFDGHGPDDPRGSTGHVAALLGVPVILVVDASAVAGSIAAIVKGFSEFDPTVHVAGVVCNRVAGPRHYAYLEPAIRRHTPVEPLGWLPRRPEWTIPERHLGLTTTEELGDAEERWAQLGQSLAETVDIDRLLALASRGPPPLQTGFSIGNRRSAIDNRIVAVARDAAFCFYYAENLELLEAAGGILRPFSPLADAALPEGSEMVYLGGGYPELHAQTLAANEPMRQSIRRFHQQGGTIYAECGGLMYAARELVTTAGQVFPMLDLLPARTIMHPRLSALSYVTLRTTRPTPLGPAGTEVRGHEYHYSSLEPLAPLTYAAELNRGQEQPRLDGLLSGNLLAGYTHLHFGSRPDVAVALMGAAVAQGSLPS